jgi:mRNA-degrading endonuclease YafQ of YafQ-DinJ toxin-antitoxin module
LSLDYIYKLYTANSKTEKRLKEYLDQSENIKLKLDRLKENPYKSNSAHKLYGRLLGKWACWLGSNIRAIYIINEKDKTVIIEAVGTHKIY